MWFQLSCTALNTCINSSPLSLSHCRFVLIWWGKRKLQSPSLSHDAWSTLCKVCCSERQPVFCSTVITVLSSQSFYGFLYHIYFTSLSSCHMKNTKINTKRSKLLRRKALEGNTPQSIKGILLWLLLVNPCHFLQSRRRYLSKKDMMSAFRATAYSIQVHEHRCLWLNKSDFTCYVFH